LTHVGGATEIVGDAALGSKLADALSVESSLAEARGATEGSPEALARAHVHGFHTYPARMHPLTARRLVEAFSGARDTVLDPFAGSGTVAVEARLAGRSAIAVDLNPLAVRLAERKLTPASASYREALVSAAKEVAAVADARRTQKRGASRRYGPEDVSLFEPHVLLELDGLRVGIDALAGRLGPDDRRLAPDLELVLSSILVKLSRKASDTSAGVRHQRIAAGFPARLFVKKTEELCRSLGAIAADLAATPPSRVLEDDARSLSGVPTGTVDLVVSSPPYPGVYDYVEHHALRLRWLRLDKSRFENAEIGAKRRSTGVSIDEAVARWGRELSAFLGAMARTLRPGGRIVLLIADSAFGHVAVRCEELVPRLGREHGLALVAVASQPRPHFHAATARAFHRSPRREHAILLERTPDLAATSRSKPS
jgi:DNA modification methylase